MPELQHPAALEHLQSFVTAPGETDTLLVAVGILLIAAILAGGVFFFWLHSLPERMVHNRIQFDIVAVLVLLSLFTHIHAFWIAALLLAVIKIPEFHTPDFAGPLSRIAAAAEHLAASNNNAAPVAPPIAVALAKPAAAEAKNA